MLIIAFFIVAVFIWLILNNPLVKYEGEDTYDYYFKQVEKKNIQEED